MPANHHTSAPPPTVLIVDDDRELVDLLTLFLSRQGIIALPAYSGQECIEIVSQRTIDVIVLDVMMPGMDGLEVCRALKAMDSTRSIPIILLTAWSDPQTRLEGLQAGASEVLIKPTMGQTLLAHIQAQIEIRRKAQ